MQETLQQNPNNQPLTNQTISQQDIQQNQVPREKPKKTNLVKILIFIVGGLFLVILGGLIVWFYFNSKDEKQAENTKNLESSPTPIITAKPEENDETSDWKTYRNEKFGFEFKYPSEWKIFDKSDRFTIFEIDQNQKMTLQIDRITGFGYCYQYGEKSEIEVDNKIAEIADGVGGTEMCQYPELYSNLGNTFVLIPINDSEQILISYEYLIDKKELAKLKFDQILSTFKFIDSENDETADWKTYRNEMYGFEFMYPRDWELGIFKRNRELFYLSLEKKDLTQELVLLPGDNKAEASYYIRFSILSNPENLSAKEYYLNEGNWDLNTKTKMEDQLELITIGDLNGIKYLVGAAPSSGVSTCMLLAKNNMVYKFSYGALAHLETHEKFMPVFDQILETFKLLN